MTPRLTVLCSVYNGARFLPLALQSVWAQDYSDFELILIDDGSTDETVRIIDGAAARDERVVVIRHKNQGLTRSLNVGLKRARGEYVARQDADDVSLPGRFSAQVRFLDRHPDTVVVGCHYLRINESGTVLGRAHVPTTDLGLRLRLLEANAIPHSGATFRRREVLEAGGYDEDFSVAQDYDLWCRLALAGRLANLRQVALYRREHPRAIGANQAALQLQSRDTIRARYQQRLLAEPRRGLSGWILWSAAALRRQGGR